MNQTTMISILFIGFIATILFVYVQQKTSRIEKNIKNVISFIKDIEKRIGENKEEVQEVSNEFVSNQEEESEEEEESEDEPEEPQEPEEPEEPQEPQEPQEHEDIDSTLDDEIINIKFKMEQDEQDYKKKTVAQLREFVVSLNLDVQELHKLKKKEIIELLDNHYADSLEPGDYNIDI